MTYCQPYTPNHCGIESLFGHSTVAPCESDSDIGHTYVLELLNTICASGLDFTPPAEERTLKDETPIVVVLHGLTGGASRLTPRRRIRISVRCRAHSRSPGSHESYVRSILAPVCTPVEQGGLGYRGIVVNFRGCERSSFSHLPNLLPHVLVHIPAHRSSIPSTAQPINRV